jgi:transcriptional regulator with GAF, ATPase, and Fis domain
MENNKELGSGYSEKARKLYESLGIPVQSTEKELEERDSSGSASALSGKAAVVIPDDKKDLIALYEASKAFGESLEPDVLLDRLIDIAVVRTGAERGLVFIKNPVSGKLRKAVARGIDGTTLADAGSYSRSVLEAGAMSPGTILCENAMEDPRFRNNKSVRKLKINSFICVPLKVGIESIGAFYLDSKKPDVTFGRGDLTFISALSSLAAVAVRNALHHHSVLKENELLREESAGGNAAARLVARSPGMKRVMEIVRKLADTDISVLVCGETGTGKELVARAIHESGRRRGKPFLALNCAAMPPNLAESILFGYRKGAFTDARDNRKGIFEAADGGTVFLDEIGDMDLDLQAKLLRVLQNREVVRIGETSPRTFDVRVVSATNRDLDAMVERGEFRRDLYYRLDVIRIDLPPLRDRKEDLPVLLEDILKRSNARLGRRIGGFHPDTVRLFEEREWPGNVRELENAVEKGVALTTDGGLIKPDIYFGEGGRGRQPGVDPAGFVPEIEDENLTLKEVVEVVEKKMLLKTLEKCGWNKSKAARMLGLNRVVLLRKIDKYGLRSG